MKKDNKNIEKLLMNEMKDITPYPKLKAIDDEIYYERIEELNKLENNKNSFFKNFISKKINLAISFVTLIILFLCIEGFIVYENEYETITLDVNPSVELVTNRFNRVINVNYNNDDAYNIFSNMRLKNKKIESAIEDCYNKLYEENYLNQEDNIIVISGCGNKHEFNNKKLENYSYIINNNANKNNIKCTVITNTVKQEEKTEAKDNNISYGKLKMIKSIQDITDEYSFEDLKNMSMNDLKNIYLQLTKNKDKNNK